MHSVYGKRSATRLERLSLPNDVIKEAKSEDLVSYCSSLHQESGGESN